MFGPLCAANNRPAARVVFETGPLSVWFYHALREEGLPAICIDARHAKSALDMAPNSTHPVNLSITHNFGGVCASAARGLVAAESAVILSLAPNHSRGADDQAGTERASC